MTEAEEDEALYDEFLGHLPLQIAMACAFATHGGLGLGISPLVDVLGRSFDESSDPNAPGPGTGVPDGTGVFCLSLALGLAFLTVNVWILLVRRSLVSSLMLRLFGLCFVVVAWTLGAISILYQQQWLAYVGFGVFFGLAFGTYEYVWKVGLSFWFLPLDKMWVAVTLGTATAGWWV